MPTTTSRDGTTIAYSVTGSGPALVLVDGALCSRNFGPMPNYAKALEDSFTVHWYDRRGRGESDDKTGATIAREVEDLGAVIQAAGGSAFVFGSSSGAALGLQGAAAGLPIQKLVMYEAPYVPTPPGGKGPKQHLEALKELVRADKRSAAVRYFMSDVVGMPKPVAWLMRLFPMWPKLKQVAHTLPNDLAIMSDEGILEGAARRLTMPVLVAGGGASPAPLKAAVERVAGAISGSSKRYLPGQTHNLGAPAAAHLMKEYFLG
jgi:pimeloyl-ACP methyl ester carboxylesterase